MALSKQTTTDKIDQRCGLHIYKKLGDKIDIGEPIVKVFGKSLPGKYTGLPPGSLNIDSQVKQSINITEASLKSFDCVIITTDHKIYDWHLIANNSKLLIDTRNATKNIKTNNRIIKI